MKIKQSPDNLVCESCGAEFSCGAVSGKCWCFEVDLKPEVIAGLRESFDQCLCLHCLEKIAAEQIKI